MTTRSLDQIHTENKQNTLSLPFRLGALFVGISYDSNLSRLSAEVD